MSYVSYVFRWTGYEHVALSSRDSNPEEDKGNILFSVEEGLGGPTATLNLNTGDTDRDYFYGSLPPGTQPFSFDAGRLTIPQVTLGAGDGSAREARVGGTVTFPMVPLRAGQETVLQREEAAEGRVSVTFSEDGTYTETTPWGTSSGTWVEETPGHLTVTIGDPSTPSARRIQTTYEVVDGDLWLATVAPSGCTLECVPSVEAGLFAEPGSFESVRYRTVTTLRRQSP